MSLIDTVMERMDQLLTRRIDEVRPFRATVASVSGGMVTIKRPGVTTAETELRARVVGYDLAVNDEVLCVVVNGKPVVVGQVQRAAPTAADYVPPFAIGDGVGRFPIGAAQSNSEFDTVFVSNATNAMYMGRAKAAYTTITIYTEVETAAATITWAEVGIGTSSAPSFGGNIDITRRGYTDVSASFNSTGEKTVAVTVSGITTGDHLWALMGSQATTPFQTIRVNHSDAIGTWQSASSTRISTMASPTSFTAQSAADQAAFGCWIGA